MKYLFSTLYFKSVRKNLVRSATITRKSEHKQNRVEGVRIAECGPWTRQGLAPLASLGHKPVFPGVTRPVQEFGDVCVSISHAERC